jgi:hypothetical protein
VSAPCGPYIGEFDPESEYRKPLVILSIVSKARFELSIGENREKVEQKSLMRLSEQYLALISHYNKQAET